MSLPTQVKKQLEEVEAIEQRLSEQVKGEPVAQQGEPPPEQTATEPALETPSAETPEVETTEPMKEPVPEPELKHDDAEQTWQARYKTLLGMYNAEVPGLYDRVKGLNRELDDLKAEVARLQQQPKKEDAPNISSVTDKDREEFGEDLIDLQRRVAAEVVTPLQSKIDSLEVENTKLRAQLGETGTRVQAFTFEQKLTAAIPDFASVDADPRWVAWLDEVDPILRGPRRAVALDAYNKGDVEGVKAYVELWKQSAGITQPKQAKEKSSTEFKAQVAPNRSTATASSVQPTERVYTETEAEALLDKVVLLNRQGKFDEAAKLDADVSTAYAQGRVR